MLDRDDKKRSGEGWVKDFVELQNVFRFNDTILNIEVFINLENGM